MKFPETTYTSMIQLRVDDSDIFGHVNHTKYMSFLEAARLDFAKEMEKNYNGEVSRGIMARVEFDYLQPLTVDKTLYCTMWLFRIGDKSYTTSYLLSDTDLTEQPNRDEVKLCSRSKTVIVAYDFNLNTTVTLPQYQRDILSKYLDETPYW